MCGDGIKTAIEECDDGNYINLDGCSDQCRIDSWTLPCIMEITEVTSNSIEVKIDFSMDDLQDLR